MNDKTKLEQLAELLKAADAIIVELSQDKEHGRSPILAGIRVCTNTALERVGNHAAFLINNPVLVAPKPNEGKAAAIISEIVNRKS